MIQQTFLETIKEYNLLSPGDKVLVAVSGGVDSIALLHLLHYIKNDFNLNLHVAHLNHMIRKGDAELDVKYVQDTAARLQLPVTVESFDVPELAGKMKKGLEAAARQARYEFLYRVAEQIEADRIAVGHNADDNVETFLMRLLRGAGLKGLCGIAPRRGRVIRPMIKLWRKEIEEYVGALKLVPRRDYTNFESKYMRNRVRMKLIPQLKLYNINIKEIVLQTILLLTEDSEYLEKSAEEVFKSAIVSGDDKKLALALPKFMELDDCLRSRVIRTAIEKVKGDLSEITFEHIFEVFSHLGAHERWEVHLPGVFVSGSGEELVVSSERPEKIEVKDFLYSLPIPGSAQIAELGRELRVSILQEEEMLDDKKAVMVDYAALGKNITVRSRKDGDKFIPLGMKGSKKIQDLFVDEKIPAEKRGLVPIVESGGKIIWVGGVRLDDRAKVTSQTKKKVKLELI